MIPSQLTGGLLHQSVLLPMVADNMTLAGGRISLPVWIRALLLQQETQGRLLVEALVPDFQGDLDSVKVGHLCVAMDECTVLVITCQGDLGSIKVGGDTLRTFVLTRHLGMPQACHMLAAEVMLLGACAHCCAAHCWLWAGRVRAQHRDRGEAAGGLRVISSVDQVSNVIYHDIW
jgi:hypothetical protein